MNYELAQKLANSGFPQRDWGDIYSCEDGHELMNIPQRMRPGPAGIDIGETISCPTLSELIEACGDGFYFLQFDPENQNRWAATSRESWKTKFAGNNPSIFQGSNPEEAVAKLWFALQQKPPITATPV